jgi:adenine-specific DNA-methyltransferase
MAIQKIIPSYKFNVEQLKQLRQIAPEAFKDNILDFNILYEALSGSFEDDVFQTEHFGLMWPGKTDAKKMVTVPSRGCLIPLFGEGVNESQTRNVFIEGENLEVLKLVQKAYAGQAKMIYIDPPYNTGNDFIYDDNFTESLEEYFKRTGQIDEQGKRLSTNTRADGRFHSKWLSMMYPRLKVARTLLKEDGVIFISIDDNELHNLLELGNEIFGEENFMGTITWLKKRKGSFLSKEMISVTEYIVVFKKSADFGYLFGGKPDSSESQPIVKRTNGITSLSIPAGIVKTKLKDGVYKKGKYGVGSSAIELNNDIKVKDNVILDPFIITGPFTWSQPYLDDQLSKGATLIINTTNFQLRAFKAYDEESYKGLPSIINGVEISATNEDAYEYLQKVFNNVKVFDYSKPVNLIKYLINAATYFDSTSLIIDFFAGSGTTCHAVMEYNLENKTEHSFIGVQLDELIENDEIVDLGYSNVSQIAKTRLKYAIKEISQHENAKNTDLGYKVYKLGYSNFKKWKNYNGTDTKQIEILFSEYESSLVDNWEPENLFSEILLLEGFPLDSKVETIETIKKNKVQKVTSDFCEHALFISLDKKVEEETIKDLKLGNNDIFICLDHAVTDQDKARLDDKGLIKTI